MIQANELRIGNLIEANVCGLAMLPKLMLKKEMQLKLQCQAKLKN